MFDSCLRIVSVVVLVFVAGIAALFAWMYWNNHRPVERVARPAPARAIPAEPPPEPERPPADTAAEARQMLARVDAGRSAINPLADPDARPGDLHEWYRIEGHPMIAPLLVAVADFAKGEADLADKSKAKTRGAACVEIQRQLPIVGSMHKSGEPPLDQAIVAVIDAAQQLADHCTTGQPYLRGEENAVLRANADLAKQLSVYHLE